MLHCNNVISSAVILDAALLNTQHVEIDITISYIFCIRENLFDELC